MKRILSIGVVLLFIGLGFIPSLSAYLQGFEVTKSHFQIASEKEQFEKKISEIWEVGIENPAHISPEQCRTIQDSIFISRKNGPLVPDWWYNLLRNKYQIDMVSVVQEFKKKAENSLKNRKT